MPIETLMSVMNTAVTVTAVMAGIFFMMRYLQRGESPFMGKELRLMQDEVQAQLHELRYRLEKEMARSSAQGPSFTEDDRKALISTLRASLKEDAARDVLAQIESTVAEKYGTQNMVSLIAQQSSTTIERLRQELFSLSKRSNLNLSIGITTTLTGLALLGMFVLQDAVAATDMEQFVIGFVPRISLVLLIEVFAYFFLRLYKSTLSEIKYFQNEITSIESKFLALTVAAATDKEEHIKGVIDHLAKAERNFILEKGQTTVDLERGKLEQQAEANVLEKISDVFKKKS